MNKNTVNTQKLFFKKNLLTWNKEENNRTMPWKGEKDPYKIWLSEIILQQTRVDQGLDYYNRFIKAFPDIKKLAGASENKVFKLWEGLGYYSRCMNLIATAKKIATDYDGQFPGQYEDILALKGVGPYTAAAIASFAFNLPYAVLDGNVFRVLARYFGYSTPTDSSEGKKIFSALANELLDRKQPGLYNQAIMDFGATVCKPQLPACSSCPLRQDCVALKKDMVNKLPVKDKKTVIKNRWFHYVVAEYKDQLLVRKREQKDIWQNLYEFILIENSKALDLTEINKMVILKELAVSLKEPGVISSPYVQKLTHQTIHARFVRVSLNKKITLKGYEWTAVSQLNQLPFPKIITSYLKDKNVSLNLI